MLKFIENTKIIKNSLKNTFFGFSFNKNSGMTILELMVVIGIFATISGTILFNYRDFSDGVSLQNLAQEIALQGKRAQTLASQGRLPVLSQTQRQGIELDGTGLVPSDWISSYGIAFDASMPKSFVFYFNSRAHYVLTPTGPLGQFTLEDKNTYFYDFVDASYVGCGSTALSECMEEIKITDGSYIDMICLNSEAADPDCANGTRIMSSVDSGQVHISFTRPYLEARITGIENSDRLEDMASAFIRISTPDDSQKRYITFWKTGQISVN